MEIGDDLMVRASWEDEPLWRGRRREALLRGCRNPFSRARVRTGTPTETMVRPSAMQPIAMRGVVVLRARVCLRQMVARLHRARDAGNSLAANPAFAYFSRTF